MLSKKKKLEESYNIFMKRNKLFSAIDLYEEYLDVLKERNKMLFYLHEEQDDLRDIYYLMQKIDKSNINLENKNILTTIYDIARNRLKVPATEEYFNTKF